MSIPDFILELRRHIGQRELWLPAVTAVVRHGDELLLVRRADNGCWAPVTGILDPGEEPAIGAAREVHEETGVLVSVDHLASVNTTGRVVHVNGDRAVYLDLTFLCTWLEGDAHVADDESTEVGWFRLDRLPDMKSELRERIAAALSGEAATRFRT